MIFGRMFSQKQLRDRQILLYVTIKECPGGSFCQHCSSQPVAEYVIKYGLICYRCPSEWLTIPHAVLGS